MINCL